MIPKSVVVSTLAAVLTAGCVHTPRVEVAERLSRPPPASAPRTYALSFQADRLPAEAGDAEVLRQALARHGWTEASGGAPGWTITAAYAVRPESVGARATADEEAWLVEPRRGVWWRRPRSVHTLTLGLVEAGAQRESHRITASISGPVKPPADTLGALADAAAARLDPRGLQPSEAGSASRGSTTTKQAPASPGS